MKSGKVFAPLTYEGCAKSFAFPVVEDDDLPHLRLHRHVFETWLEKSLLPQLNSGDIIVIDNATFHKGQSIQEIVQNVECEIWYLPPPKQSFVAAVDANASVPCSARSGATHHATVRMRCSPDLNKIERWWSVLKTWMKQRIYDFQSIRECVDSAFAQCPNVFP